MTYQQHRRKDGTDEVIAQRAWNHYMFNDRYRRNKQRQATRCENVRVAGTRDWRRTESCTILCGQGFCPCNLPRVVNLRTRTCQRVATSFMRWCRFREGPCCARDFGAASVVQVRPERYIKWEAIDTSYPQ